MFLVLAISNHEQGACSCVFLNKDKKLLDFMVMVCVPSVCGSDHSKMCIPVNYHESEISSIPY